MKKPLSVLMRYIPAMIRKKAGAKATPTDSTIAYIDYLESEVQHFQREHSKCVRVREVEVEAASRECAALCAEIAFLRDALGEVVHDLVLSRQDVDDAAGLIQCLEKDLDRVRATCHSLRDDLHVRGATDAERDFIARAIVRNKSGRGIPKRMLEFHAKRITHERNITQAGKRLVKIKEPQPGGAGLKDDSACDPA